MANEKNHENVNDTPQKNVMLHTFYGNPYTDPENVQDIP